MKQHKAQYQSRGCIFMGALLFVLMNIQEDYSKHYDFKLE